MFHSCPLPPSGSLGTHSEVQVGVCIPQCLEVRRQQSSPPQDGMRQVARKGTAHPRTVQVLNISRGGVGSSLVVAHLLWVRVVGCGKERLRSLPLARALCFHFAMHSANHVAGPGLKIALLAKD